MAKTVARRPGRKPTGTVAWSGSRWRARITAADGSRPWVDLDPTIPRDDVEGARAASRLVAEAAVRVRAVSAQGGPTVAEWWHRYFAWRERQPRAETIPQRYAKVERWILPILGAKLMVRVTEDDLRRVVRRLDDAVAEGAIKPKTARNLWGEVTKAFADARELNVDALRVRRDNPAEHVRGPAKGEARSKTFLRPAELVSLLECDAEPIHRRHLWAVAAYTGLRIGELRGLRVGDVDREGGQIVVVRQASETGAVRHRTKTGRARVVPIEPALDPLLGALVDGRAPDEALLDIRNEPHGLIVRAALRKVGCTREALHANDEMRAPFTFHNFRDTCLTHMAVRRDPPQDIQWRAGHSTPAMTERYCAEARFNAGAGFGHPFPPLPVSVMARSVQTPRKRNGFGRPQGDSNTPNEDSSASRPHEPLEGKVSRTHSATEGAKSSVTEAIAEALQAAARAGRWDVVAQLARELEARRLEAEPNVVSLRRGRP